MTHFAKCVAFTLAETLVVMGIIGVVAALTIPKLNQATGDREKVAKVKKVYSNLEDAFGRATAVYGPIDEWFVNADDEHECLFNRITEFMKLSKNCDSENGGCFSADEVKNLDGGNDASSILLTQLPYAFLTADGTAIGFLIFDGLCNSDVTADSDEANNPLENTCAAAYVDIDGAKGTNTMGKDIFGFIITKDGLYPAGSRFQYNSDDNDIPLICFEEGNCTAWIIETGNMDYLKADRKGKCPNGTQLSWENTTCK